MGNYIHTSAHTPLFYRMFPGCGVLHAVQSNLGFSYSGTPYAQGTTPPAITWTVPATFTRPCIIKCNTLGALNTWKADVYYDGGTNKAESFTSAASVTLGSGIVLAIPAGNAAVNNTWTAWCSQWSDLSGNGSHKTPVGAGKPLFQPGLNGQTSVYGGGVAAMIATVALPNPSVTKVWRWLLFRQRTWSANAIIAGGSSVQNNTLIFQHTGSPNIAVYSGGFGTDNNGAALNAWVRAEAEFNASNADYLKLGTVNPGPVATGSATASATTGLFGYPGGTSLSDTECLAEVIGAGTYPTATQFLAAGNAAQQLYGAGLGI